MLAFDASNSAKPRSCPRDTARLIHQNDCHVICNRVRAPTSSQNNETNPFWSTFWPGGAENKPVLVACVGCESLTTFSQHPSDIVRTKKIHRRTMAQSADRGSGQLRRLPTSAESPDPDEQLSNQSRRQCPACAPECGLEISRSIRC
jgi:hypothetical protein